MKYDLDRCTHTREAYGDALIGEAKRNRDIVVIDGDVSNSTKTDRFAREFPDRFINVGIAEQNMVNIAAGLAHSGKIPFVSTFPVFGCGRAWEQIRNTVALDSLNVKLVMTHAGLSLGGDGATHQGLEDIAIMRVIPNMEVIVPADGAEVKAVIRHTVANRGPVYIRLSRRRSIVLFDDDYRYDPREYPVIRDGDDVAVFASGCMIREALIAAESLAKAGISARVIDMHTVKPLPRDCVLAHARETGRVVSVEEHNVLGGAGSALAELLAEEYPAPMRLVGVRDRFGRSGQVDALFDLLGISSRYISEAVQILIRTERS
ncbi:MAG TPA: transketolase family protein [Methanomicrobiales archaeon]|nr:transketolase family protein [Methanomicrobiales archaeon]